MVIEIFLRTLVIVLSRTLLSEQKRRKRKSIWNFIIEALSKLIKTMNIARIL